MEIAKGSVDHIARHMETRLRERISERQEALEQERNRRLEEARKKKKERLEKLVKQGEEKIEEEMQGKLEKARIGGQVEILKARKQAVGRAISKFIEELPKLKSTSKYKDFMRRELKSARSSLGSGMKVTCSKKDASLCRKQARSVKAADELDGGFIAESRDGNRRIDMSISRLIDERREQLIISILKGE